MPRKHRLRRLLHKKADDIKKQQLEMRTSNVCWSNLARMPQNNLTEFFIASVELLAEAPHPGLYTPANKDPVK